MSRTNAAGLARGRPRSPFCELTPVDGIAIYSLPRGSFPALPSAWICPASGGLRRGAFSFHRILEDVWAAKGGHLITLGAALAQPSRRRPLDRRRRHRGAGAGFDPENRLYLACPLMVWSILIVQAFSSHHVANQFA